LRILKSDRYAVVGNPIAQSKSPIIHTMFAQATGHAITYERIEAPLGGFATTVKLFRDQGGHGINVTAPFKLEAFAHATHASEAARIAGAANALKFDGDDVYAENFDGIGLLRDIEKNLNVAIEGKRVLILGAGGATRGALTPLLRANPSEILVANRDVGKAQMLVHEIATQSTARAAATSYDALPESYFEVILNATSSSLSQALPPITAALFARCTLAYDLTYGKGATPFLKLAQQNSNAQIADGVGMLVEQAAEAFAWWRGDRPATKDVIKALTVPLA
jgi:shikimate dehydrogenase